MTPIVLVDVYSAAGRGTIRCNRAAKPGVLKWMINRRRRLIGNVIRSIVGCMVSLNAMSDMLTLVENFDGMDFLNSPRIIESDQFLKIETDSINTNAVAVFMSLVVLAITAITYFLGGGRNAALVLVAGMMAGSMFVGLFYLLAANDRNRMLPQIEKRLEHLVLANGTTIPKPSIECFRQYSCKTKMSNFKLVLTTVVTGGSNGAFEYAVAPVIGTFSEDCIGDAFASFFDVRLIQDNNRTFTANELTELGLS